MREAAEVPADEWDDVPQPVDPDFVAQAREDWGAGFDEECGLQADQPALDWVIVGGESGPGARPMHPEWARSLRDQCQAAGVPFFFKQWGAWAPSSLGPDIARASQQERVWRDGEWTGAAISPVECSAPDTMNLVSKAAAGRLLDGRTWDEMPEASR
ncbi:DUF5131 family protein [Albimonas pacifica]|uniref:Phage protein Gp37/Gp68 n=1 Tax=Albimonas pacifica TaxID=1114924 RepID=A0A1I3FVC7_9RHOB|nr:DUF5131 family protein [Albimonas pacifica]SFI15135.1 Phage protein Gp37/Gp68 [Albimonas pacifica]